MDVCECAVKIERVFTGQTEHSQWDGTIARGRLSHPTDRTLSMRSAPSAEAIPRGRPAPALSVLGTACGTIAIPLAAGRFQLAEAYTSNGKRFVARRFICGCLQRDFVP